MIVFKRQSLNCMGQSMVCGYPPAEEVFGQSAGKDIKVQDTEVSSKEFHEGG